MLHFQSSIFSIIVSLFHRRALEAIHMSRRLCYFTALVANIHDNKWSVVDSIKIEGYVYLRKTILALLF